jgi:lipoate-protein ligase A
VVLTAPPFTLTTSAPYPQILHADLAFDPLAGSAREHSNGVRFWLLTQHLQEQHPPTLRFYTWKPATISLGYHQYQWSASWQQLTWQGEPLDLVRRPSGGRAVLHQGDLTYAVVTSGLSTKRLEAYKTICEFLIQGWRSLGVTLQYGEAGRGYMRQANCFGTATGADLVLADGSKLIGSAQLRRGSGHIAARLYAIADGCCLISTGL